MPKGARARVGVVGRKYFCMSLDYKVFPIFSPTNSPSFLKTISMRRRRREQNIYEVCERG